MINEIALVFIGILIGALSYYVIGWVTFDRTVQELTLEARTMRSENAELRTVLRDLMQLVEAARAPRQHDGVALAGPLMATSLEESIYSMSVERDLSGRARAQALVDSGYFPGR